MQVDINDGAHKGARARTGLFHSALASLPGLARLALARAPSECESIWAGLVST